jgi:manganese/zinc/iron transport system permease protein
MELLRDLFLDYTLRNVALGAALLGIVSGVLGSFAVLKKQGLLGDALSHAALPGICLAYLVSGSKAAPVLMLGAALSGWAATLCLLAIVRRSRLGEDAGLGIVLSTFFGAGIVLLSLIQHGRGASQAGLDSYLFGQAATLTAPDVATMLVLGALALGATGLVYKELKLFAFDPEFGASLGFGSARLAVLLTGLVVVAVVIGLQTVGVVLMSAMLVGPAAAARQWTNRLGVMIALAAAIGAASGVLGALASVAVSRLPTGPSIVLVLTAFVALSLAVAPERGFVWQWARARRRTLAAPPWPAEALPGAAPGKLGGP